MLILEGPPEWKPEEAGSVLTRCQRCLQRRNRASQLPIFERAFLLYRSMFDLGNPLALADYRHAIDTWQWSLRLSPHASLHVQLAALLHDIERLGSETGRRAEHRAVSQDAFKGRHVERGARMANLLLLAVDAPPALATRTADLVERHEGLPSDDELGLVADADALSFFSLNSPGYLHRFGQERTMRKVRHTLARMTSPAVARLARVHLHPAVRDFVAAELGS